MDRTRVGMPLNIRLRYPEHGITTSIEQKGPTT